jgi:hypothetical protein
MSEYEIIEGLDKVQELCGQVVNRMVLAKKQGRMLSIGEARKMDQRSLELTQLIKALSRHSISQMSSPELKRRAETLLDLSRSTLRLVVQSDSMAARTRTANTRPRAASSRLEAYCAC